jgi:hypothetical protein
VLVIVMSFVFCLIGFAAGRAVNSKNSPKEWARIDQLTRERDSYARMCLHAFRTRSAQTRGLQRQARLIKRLRGEAERREVLMAWADDAGDVITATRKHKYDAGADDDCSRFRIPLFAKLWTRADLTRVRTDARELGEKLRTKKEDDT